MSLYWYPRHVDRWRKSARVMAMSLAARGAYVEMLDYCWLQDECKIPNHPHLFWKFVNANGPAEWDAIKDEVLPMFSVIEDGQFLQNETLLLEWKKATEISQRRSEAGKIGNKIKYGRNCETNTSQTDRQDTTPQNKEPLPLRGVIERIFSVYLTKTSRTPQTYRLTSARVSKGLSRLHERLKANDGDLCAAEDDLLRAVDALCSSDWHTGRDPKTNGKKYLEWESHLMKSEEQLEKWLNHLPAKKPQVVEIGSTFAQQQRERRAAAAADRQKPESGMVQ